MSSGITVTNRLFPKTVVSRKTKLLFVSNLFPDVEEPYRGLDNATLLHQLTTKFDIRVLSPRPGLPFSRFPQKACRPEDRLFSPVYVQAPYIPKIGSRFNHVLMAGALRPALLALRGEFPFEVILGSWVYPDGCAISQLASEMKFPFVIVAQGSDVHQYLKNPVRRKIIARSMASASALITRSAELGHLLNRAGVAGEMIHTVYNGIDFSNFNPRDILQARQSLGLPEIGRAHV